MNMENVNAEQDDYDEEDSASHFNNRSAVIFLIDFRKAMFERGDDGSNNFRRCVECCKSVMISLARKEHRNWATGIVAMGTEKTKNQTIPKRVAELQCLDVVSVNRIVELTDMILDDFSTAVEEYGQSDKIVLSAALHYCQVAFKKWRQHIYNKTVIIFTNDDDPFANDIVEAHKSRKQAEDFRLWHIDLDIVPFGEFDKNKFYKELIMTVKGDLFDDWAQLEKDSTVEDIVKAVQNIVGKFHSHHRFLHLGSSRSVAVDLFRPYIEPYTILKKYQPPSEGKEQDVHESQEGNQDGNEVPVEGTAKDGLPKRKVYYPSIGGKSLKMSKQTMIEKSAKTKVGFTLLGFYPTNDIPEYYTMAPPYLMIPNFKDRDNASLFTCLWRRCMDRELSMICWHMYHKTSSPRLVSVTPTHEFKIADGIMSPSGFIVTTLPFLDEWCEVNDDEIQSAEPSEKQQAAAQAIVKKLNFAYTPDKFHSYEHRKMVAMVEAIALGYDDTEEFEDDTDIDLESITERLGSLSSEFMDCSHLGEIESSSVKRKYPDATSRQPKTAKMETTNEDWLKMIHNGMANKLTVAQLRSLLQAEGVKSLSTYTKPRLVELANLRFCKDSQLL